LQRKFYEIFGKQLTRTTTKSLVSGNVKSRMEKPK
jgi:hypothetical protein